MRLLKNFKAEDAAMVSEAKALKMEIDAANKKLNVIKKTLLKKYAPGTDIAGITIGKPSESVTVDTKKAIQHFIETGIIKEDDLKQFEKVVTRKSSIIVKA